MSPRVLQGRRIIIDTKLKPQDIVKIINGQGDTNRLPWKTVNFSEIEIALIGIDGGNDTAIRHRPLPLAEVNVWVGVGGVIDKNAFEAQRGGGTDTYFVAFFQATRQAYRKCVLLAFGNMLAVGFPKKIEKIFDEKTGLSGSNNFIRTSPRDTYR